MTISFYNVFVFNHFWVLFQNKVKQEENKNHMHLKQQLLICWFVALTLYCEYVWGINRDSICNNCRIVP